ncbi:hypothetical protein FRC0513_02115 [Corynebacterium diphtheriae]|nr:hypothetical protein FRC0322_01913 [Corynebacterium diphtheriae]CAB0872844.1 hypothetical protein FRC0356_02114 [Corynebacterium diphtheriae]CAB0969887.1 hypothetical protein FRC0469_02041 [Corynebacterium diphtheriae]CAB1009862.1 hypothetical protein FRC0513_02115 [Corynebacterium diphtheriae]CAB1012960.1 hypothetical protein FRC0514_02230 [Corynebacterium diphtheriae]
MGLRSLEYEDTTKPDTRQGVFLVLVWLLVCTRVSGILQHEIMMTKTPPPPRPHPGTDHGFT